MNEKKFFNQISEAETGLKNKQQCITPCKIFGSILKKDEMGTQTNRPRDEKIHNDANRDSAWVKKRI